MNLVSVSNNYPNQQKTESILNKKSVNFRSVKTPINQKDDTDIFLKEYEKQKKQAKKDKRLQTGISLFIAGTFAVLAGVTLHQSGIFGKKVQKAVAKDISNEKTLKELCLGKELQQQTDEIKLLLERSDILKEKGVNSMQPIFLYSEPGSGKNAWVYGLAKDTNATLFEVNVLKFNDMYNGQSENNVLKFIENVKKAARKTPDKPVIVYFDEIDSVALKDVGVNSGLSNKMKNAFKTGFNDLLKEPNVQIIGSSNKAYKGESLTQLLDEAIINRFGKKIYVPLPNTEQLQNCFIENFKRISNKDLVSDELLTKNETLKKMCDFLSQEGHEFSFRDAEDILAHAKVLSELNNSKGTKITMKHLKESVIDKANQLNWPQSEIDALKVALG